MTLRAATPADFDFIRRLAGDPANAPYITDEDEAALQAYLDNPDTALLIWQTEGAQGYALFCGLGEDRKSTRLNSSH